MRKKIVGILAVAAFLAPIAAGAMTQEEWQLKQEENRQSLENRKTAFQESKGKMVEGRCKIIETRIEERTSRFEEGKTRRINAYDNMLARLEKLSYNLKEKGNDVTQLNADIATLATKIEKFKTDYATFIASLGQTQEFACGKSEGEFKGKLGESRKNLPMLRADVKDIHDYFRTTIKADFKAIRDQKVEKPETTSGE